MNNFNFGENLRITRQTKGISQESMAWNLNISQATYSRIESEKIMPDRQQSAKIGKILGIPPPDSLPILKELDHDTMVSTRGLGLGWKASLLFATPIGFIIKIGLAFALANVACDAASGACDGMETSANTKLFTSWIAAVAMITCFYYWTGQVRKTV